MSEKVTIEPVAHIETNLDGKFGLPRQSGVVPELMGRIVFEEPYRNPDALRGLEGFSHLWLVWQFSEAVRKGVSGFSGDSPYSPTVRPPRLGGNERLGVFATRSPYRPNNLGLSAVKMERILLPGSADDTCATTVSPKHFNFDEDLVHYKDNLPDGPVILVSGVDLMDGTPIFDIKPYIPYADSIPTARGGFTATAPELKLTLGNPEELHSFALAAGLDEEMEFELTGLLRNDPRPQYQHDPERVYGLTYGGRNVRFRISESHVLTVLGIE